MARKNFSKAVKVACIKRATKPDGNAYCEKCGALAKRYHIDHVDPDGLTGQPVLENAMLLCLPCHDEKTLKDVSNIAKAKRREAKDLGVKPDGPKLQSRGFTPSGKQARIVKQSLAPRALYEDVET